MKLSKDNISNNTSLYMILGGNKRLKDLLKTSDSKEFKRINANNHKDSIKKRETNNLYNSNDIIKEEHSEEINNEDNDNNNNNNNGNKIDKNEVLLQDNDNLKEKNLIKNKLKNLKNTLKLSNNINNIDSLMLQKFQLDNITPEKTTIIASGLKCHDEFYDLVNNKNVNLLEYQLESVLINVLRMEPVINAVNKTLYSEVLNILNDEKMVNLAREKIKEALD
jgi:hypothetical protein